MSVIMEKERVKEIRQNLGVSQRQLAGMLKMGPNGDRTIRRWETGVIEITGPASVALELLEKEYARQ